MKTKKFLNLKKSYFIAEIGVNHNNDMALAKKMIISAKSSGANAVKFQTFKAEKLVTPKTPLVKYQKKSTRSGKTHYDMIKSLELSEKNHLKLKKFCREIDIDFLSTPYDLDSAKFLNKIGCKIFKTASADIVDLELHTYLAKNKKKVIISTGMSNFQEIDKCIKIYRKHSNKNFILLHCVSNYPCSLKSLNLNIIPKLKKRYKCTVGYSDHSVGSIASILSVALGAKVIEKHFTINKNLSGPDQKASDLPKDFKKMVEEIRSAEIALGKSVKKCQPEETQMSKVSRKSLTLNKNILKGQEIKRSSLVMKRPGTGIFFYNLSKVLGKKVKKNLKKNYQIKLSDLK